MKFDLSSDMKSCARVSRVIGIKSVKDDGTITSSLSADIHDEQEDEHENSNPENPT